MFQFIWTIFYLEGVSFLLDCISTYKKKHHKITLKGRNDELNYICLRLKRSSIKRKQKIFITCKYSHYVEVKAKRNMKAIKSIWG